MVIESSFVRFCRAGNTPLLMLLNGGLDFFHTFSHLSSQALGFPSWQVATSELSADYHLPDWETPWQDGKIEAFLKHWTFVRCQDVFGFVNHPPCFVWCCFSMVFLHSFSMFGFEEFRKLRLVFTFCVHEKEAVSPFKKSSDVTPRVGMREDSLKQMFLFLTKSFSDHKSALANGNIQ